MNKTFKYIVLLALACFVGKANAQELKTEVFSLLNLDYPGESKDFASGRQRRRCGQSITRLLPRTYQRENSGHQP